MDKHANHLSRRGLLISAVSLVPVARILRAQAAPPSTFTTGVKVVNVLATVRDHKGDLVHALTKDDFTIEEEGRPQPITYFSRDTNLPLTLGLLVDTSASQRRVIDQEKSASREFLRHILREDQDHAFLIHFDREVELLQDLTSSRSDLEKALNTLETPQLRRQGDSRDPNDSGTGGGSPGGGGYPRRSGGVRGFGGGTALYDAVLLASNELMQKQTGRKALILLTDGVDNGSKTSIDSAIEAAQRADTLVYSIYFADDEGYGGGRGGGFGGGAGGVGIGGGGMGRHGGMGRRGPASEPRPDGKKILERISRETGGAMFEASKKHPLDEIFDKIEAELRNQYSLGFTPDPKGVSGYRKLHVTAKGKGFTVQARSGYYYGA